MTDLGNKSAQDLAGYIGRIESLNEEKMEVAERIKAEFAEAAGQGFDKKALKQIIKERAADSEKTVTHRAVVETYRRALGGLSGTPLGDWARGWVADDERHRLREKEASTVLSDWLEKSKAEKSKAGDDGRASE